jgi:CBS domain-containing membrane protein
MHASDPVNRVMTAAVLTIGPEDSLSEAFRLFAGYPVHHLPVVEGRRVIGMLSSADVAKLKFFLPPPGPALDALLKDRWRVRQILRSPAITVPEHESVQRAAELMARNGIHSLPVVNSNDMLVGIVTTTDLIHGSLSSASIGVSRADDKTNQAPSAGAHVRALERVAHIARRLLNLGPNERLHAELQIALDRADELEDGAGRRAGAELNISG